MGGKGIVVPTVSSCDVVDLPSGEGLSAFEHHVFEKMADAGRASFFVARPNAVPYHRRNNWDGPVLSNENG